MDHTDQFEHLDYWQRHKLKKRGFPVADRRRRKRPQPHTGKEVTAEIVRELLSYDPETGILTWLPREDKRWSGRMAGKAVTRKKGGYVVLCVLDGFFLAHRIIWLWMTGRWPNPAVDHIDGDPSNNRWSNLREATQAQNSFNRRGKNGAELPRGYASVGGRFYAKLMCRGKRIALGVFRTKEEAHAAYIEGTKKYFGEFARAKNKGRT